MVMDAGASDTTTSNAEVEAMHSVRNSEGGLVAVPLSRVVPL